MPLVDRGSTCAPRLPFFLPAFVERTSSLIQLVPALILKRLFDMIPAGNTLVDVVTERYLLTSTVRPGEMVVCCATASARKTTTQNVC